MSKRLMHDRDLIGTQVVDYVDRVKVRRLRRERIQRIQSELSKVDFGGLILFDPINLPSGTTPEIFLLSLRR